MTVAGTRLGFADITPVTNGSELRNYRTGDVVPLMNGRTLPVKFRIEHGAIAVISPDAGGTAVLAGGTIAVHFPPGAVDHDIGVTALPVPVGMDRTDTFIVPGTLFELSPSPIEFSVPVRLTLALPAVLPAGMRAHRLAVCKMIAGACRPIPNSVVDPDNRTVSAEITGFSQYGVTEWPEVLRWVVMDLAGPNSGTSVGGQLTTAAGEVLVVPNGEHGPGDIASWSPDGSTVVYSAWAPGGGNDIRVASADGAVNTIIFHDPTAARFAKWAPDGARILVQVWDERCGREACKLAVITASGTGFTPLALGTPWFNAFDWSPDGQWIAFSDHDWAGAGCLCVVKVDGSGLRPVVTAALAGSSHYGLSSVAWSPLGNRIAFDGAVEIDGSWQEGLFVVNVDGSGLRMLTTGHVRGVSWSPAGDRLLYTREGIHVIGADGLGERYLADGDVPFWSPDGRRVAFAAGARVWIINADGSGLQPLSADNELHEADPFWRP